MLFGCKNHHFFLYLVLDDIIVAFFERRLFSSSCFNALILYVCVSHTISHFLSLFFACGNIFWNNVKIFLKLVSAIFYQIFISHQMIALQKL